MRFRARVNDGVAVTAEEDTLTRNSSRKWHLGMLNYKFFDHVRNPSPANMLTDCTLNLFAFSHTRDMSVTSDAIWAPTEELYDTDSLSAYGIEAIYDFTKFSSDTDVSSGTVSVPNISSYNNFGALTVSASTLALNVFE